MVDPEQRFDSLVESRKSWIERTLRPWCRVAGRSDLIKAEQEWLDIAGQAAPEQTLWTWAWERFPNLVCEGLTGVNETRAVRVEFVNGESVTGFPEGRRSQRGELFLLVVPEEDSTQSPDEAGPFSIDEIAAVHLPA